MFVLSSAQNRTEYKEQNVHAVTTPYITHYIIVYPTFSRWHKSQSKIVVIIIFYFIKKIENDQVDIEYNGLYLYTEVRSFNVQLKKKERLFEV